MLAFTAGLQLHFALTDADIMSALKAAHIAADEYYTVRHALAWDTDFVIPAAAIDADSTLFQSCGRDFAQAAIISSQPSVDRTYILHIRNNRAENSGHNTTRIRDAAGICGKWHNTVSCTWFPAGINGSYYRGSFGPA